MLIYKILVWTTTPWTLPSNLALAVGNSINHACITYNKICYIVAESSMEEYKPHILSKGFLIEKNSRRYKNN